MSDAAEAEFGTLALWTARVAAEMGPEYFVPAGCRGSGSPAALDWLLDGMGVRAGSQMVDCGAGVGGPAAYAAQQYRVDPVLVEPEADACRAAKTLFEYPVVRAAGSALPFPESSVGAAWSLGVLCTTSNQLGLLTELGRIVLRGGRIGLLVFVAHGAVSGEVLQDNDFPTEDQLDDLVREAALRVDDRRPTTELPPAPESWTRRVDEFTGNLADRYGHSRAWQLAERQSSTIGRLLDDGVLRGELLVLRHA